MTDTATRASAFSPDWVTCPGDTIAELLVERDWTQQDFAQRIGYSSKHVNELIKGKVALTEDAAIRLQNVLGSTAGFWLKREAQFRERAASLEATSRHANEVAWLERFPLRAMMDLNVLPRLRIDARSKPSLVGALLSFFGVASSKEWQSQYGEMELSFRRSREDQADVAAISVWLRMGERMAEKVEVVEYDPSRFRAALQEIRSLTVQGPPAFEPRMRQLLHDAGVVFALVPALPRTHVSGVARWINPHRPLIQLSLYGKQNDRFWFSFFHEAAHILLHSKQKRSVFLDDPGKSNSTSTEEVEANAWARDWLIPPKSASALNHLAKTKAAVASFAGTLGIHPGIVVGRMQHDGLLEPQWLNDLKVSFRLNTDENSEPA